MIYVWTIIYIITIFFTGYSVFSFLFSKEKASPEKTISLSFLIGTGIVPLLCFYASSSGISLSRFFILCIFLTASAITLCRTLKKKNPELGESLLVGLFAQQKDRKNLLFFPIAIIGLSLAVIFSHAVLMPLYEWDAFSIWFLKAKVIFHHGILGNEYFNTLPLSYSHLDYPLLLPILFQNMYLLAGHINENIARIVLPLISIAYLFLLLDSFAGTGQKWKILIIALLFSIPSFVRWAGAGTADVPLVIFQTCALLHAVFFILRNKKNDLTIFLIFSLFICFTKNEGLALSVINITAISIIYVSQSPGKLKNLFLPFSVFAIFLAPLLMWKFQIHDTHENYLARLSPTNIVGNLWKLKTVLYLFLNNFLNYRLWGIFWIIFLLSFLFSSKETFKNKAFIFLSLVFAADLFLYIIIFCVSPRDIEYLANMTLERITLHLIPPAYLLIIRIIHTIIPD